MPSSAPQRSSPVPPRSGRRPRSPCVPVATSATLLEVERGLLWFSRHGLANNSCSRSSYDRLDVFRTQVAHRDDPVAILLPIAPQRPRWASSVSICLCSFSANRSAVAPLSAAGRAWFLVRRGEPACRQAEHRRSDSKSPHCRLERHFAFLLLALEGGQALGGLGCPNRVGKVLDHARIVFSGSRRAVRPLRTFVAGQQQARRRRADLILKVLPSTVQSIVRGFWQRPTAGDVRHKQSGDIL